MKRYRYFCFLSFLLTALTTTAQTIYKDYEVDSAAIPRGGLPMLEKFISVNRRVPYSAEVSKTKGIVILSAVIEPNGTVSGVKPLRSLTPDCDREAVRVFSAFRAWKPALKAGQPVRQELSYTIRFAPSLADAKPDRKVQYFDKKGALTTDEANADYQFITFVDSLGYPNADPVIYRKAGKNWKEFERYRLKREPFTHQNNNDPTLPDSLEAYRLEISDGNNTVEETQYSFFADGTPLSTIAYFNGKVKHPSRYYFRNGIVRELEEAVDENKTEEWLWHPNGQLRQIALRDLSPEATVRFRLLSQWDSLGRPTVVDGNGQALFESGTRTRKLLETGAVKNGVKDGEWTGRRENGELAYRETYENGKCLSGKSYTEKGDVLTYTEPEINPEFKGGMSALGQFLASNIRYPSDAARAKVQGKVIVSFVVGKEGTVENAKVVKGIGYGADEEALRVVKATSGKWKPGVHRGQAIRVKYMMPINFAIQ
ncbi:TonB family protein [Larkinella sp. VNQ87]|uniref:TonB family protein n=1 Tax=Larkinella sp. VNQ87 TaxID=3400921 RepID=UPI003C0F7DA2